MAKDILRNDISELLDMIHDQHSIISSYEGKIPQIEMDIIMSNIRKLYDDFFELNKLNQNYRAEAIPEETTQAGAAVEPSAVTEPEPKPKQEEPPVDEDISKPAGKETLQEPPPAKTSAEPAKPKETTRISSRKTPVADLFAGTENVPVADKFRNEKQTLHDRISGEKKEKTLIETIHNPIADLRTGIGVNDRFLFINELFGGSMQDYLAAVGEINSCGTREDAIKKIWEMQEEYKWDNNSDALNRLLGFIDRRFV